LQAQSVPNLRLLLKVEPCRGGFYDILPRKFSYTASKMIETHLCVLDVY